MNRRLLALISLILIPSVYAFSRSDYEEKCENTLNDSLQHKKICEKFKRKLYKQKTRHTSKHRKKKTEPIVEQQPEPKPSKRNNAIKPNTPTYTNKTSNYSQPNNSTLSGLKFKPYTPGAYQQPKTSELNNES